MMQHRKPAALAALLAGACLGRVAATPAAPAYNQQVLPSNSAAAGLAKQENFYSGPQLTQTTSRNQIVIPVIGDIGRTGGLQSINQANPGCPLTTGPGATGNYLGYPASALDPTANFGGAGNTDDDIAGSYQAYQTAGILNGVCANLATSSTPCDFVLNTGDNFYQCGADDMFNPGGYPLGTGANAMSTRLYTDWYALYQTSATPAIQSLPWYSTIGNHDVPTPGGVDLEIAYDRSPLYAPYGANWNLPARYYSLDYYNPSNTAVSVRVINLNTNPCVADYTNKAGKAMYALSNELLMTATAEYVAAQMNWLNQTLIGAGTGCGGTGCANVVVMSHYSLYGTDQGFGALNSNDPSYRKSPSAATGTWLPGTRGRFNCWGQIQNIFQQQNGKYAPDVWVNGHDHTNAISMSSDYNTTAGADTIFVTSGTGSLWQAGDGYPAGKGGNLSGVFPSIPGSNGAYPFNVLFSSPSPDASVANGGVSVITVTASALTVDTYVTQNGPQIPAGGAPCDIAAVANGQTATPVWSATGAFNWSAVVASAPYQIGDSTTLTCNLCMNTSTPAVCGSTAWTTVPGATPSGYITSTTSYTAAIKAYTCTSSNGMTTSCTCQVPGYPAAGFIASGSSNFAICQNVSAFYALGNTVPGTTAPPMGVSGIQSPTWMSTVLYNSAGGYFSGAATPPPAAPSPAVSPPAGTPATSPPPASTPAAVANSVITSAVTLAGYTTTTFGTAQAAGFKSAWAMYLSVSTSSIVITGVSNAAAGRHLLQTGVTVSFAVTAASASAATTIATALTTYPASFQSTLTASLPLATSLPVVAMAPTTGSTVPADTTSSLPVTTTPMASAANTVRAPAMVAASALAVVAALAF